MQKNVKERQLRDRIDEKVEKLARKKCWDVGVQSNKALSKGNESENEKKGERLFIAFMRSILWLLSM